MEDDSNKAFIGCGGIDAGNDIYALAPVKSGMY
jgi:hypothetical protein